MTVTKGLYIHVPFCGQRCIYCDFYSTTSAAQYAERYVLALCEELRMRGGDTLHTIYIGGGTPSLLTLTQLHTIMDTIHKYYDTSHVKECTIEVNPDDLTTEYAVGLHRMGFNRLSMGVQTFSDRQLRFLNRRHSAQEAQEAVAIARDAGFDNLTIDLIYGLPQQTLEEWQKDIETALSLPITHLSSYALIYEEGTALNSLKKQGKVCEATDELQLSMYNALIDVTSERGFHHYEISNFARSGLEAVHNTSYWQGLPYIGCGPGAHSYDGQRTRRLNLPNLKDYVATPHEVPFNLEQLSEEELYEELILTRMRLSSGLAWSEVPKERLSYLSTAAQPYIDKGLLIDDGQSLRLSRQGIFISDTIFADLI